MTLYDDEEDALCCRRFLEKSGLQSIAATNDSNVPLPGWARSLDRLTLAAMPPSAMNINVDGRRLAGPVQGFGRLWEKRYRLHLQANGPCAPGDRCDLAGRVCRLLAGGQFPVSFGKRADCAGNHRPCSTCPCPAVWFWPPA
ncbi:MAG: hypothetical protein MZV70_25010 [Desulfobacterales bacterium]|nr:hypothetical protein [Desulfobacterales bacterium]